jgi:DnaJ family protein A protein 3
VLSDESKRQQYDAFGTASDNMGSARAGAGAGPTGGSAGGTDRFSGSWTYQSQVDPEEFFRKIFGNARFNASDFEEDIGESNFHGFGAAKEVITRLRCTKPMISH